MKPSALTCGALLLPLLPHAHPADHPASVLGLRDRRSGTGKTLLFTNCGPSQIRQISSFVYLLMLEDPDSSFGRQMGYMHFDQRGQRTSLVTDGTTTGV